MNEDDDISSKIYRLEDTKYHHLRKQNAIRTCLLPETEIALQQTFRSLDISTARTFLCIGSIITQSQIKLGPAFMAVSSMIYSLIFLFLRYFQGLYFCSQFQIETWLIFAIFKKDNAFAGFLNDKLRKYRYNP